MSNVIIRAAMPADCVALARLARDTFLHAFIESNEPQHIQNYVAKAFSPAQISKELLDDEATFFVAERDAALIAYAKVRGGKTPECIKHTNIKELERIYVDNRYIGTGIGRMLLDAAVATAVRANSQYIWLGVWKENPEAVAFYRKCGFEIMGSKVFMMGQEAQEDYVMLLNISHAYDTTTAR